MGRLERLEQRRHDSSILVKASMVNEAYKQMRQSESVRYAIGAMQPIDPEYTKNTFAQGDRVKSQLQQRLTQKCDFEYQGSTDTDTHIKARSDIDLLMIYVGWVWVEQPAPMPYRGDPAADIRQFRRDAATALRAAFPQAEHDDTRARAIRVTGASLTRRVDTVPASWHDTGDYARTLDKVLRGVKIFDKNTGEFKSNLPFLHKKRIEARDQETRGGFRKAVRLLKTLMYDSEGRCTISSYNICGVAYNIAPSSLTVQRPRELAILERCHEYCQRLLFEAVERDRILVPDGHRKVFGGEDGASLAQLQALANEIGALQAEVLRENAGTIRRLVEATVDYPTNVPVYR